MTDMKTIITRHLDAAFEVPSDSHVVPVVLLYGPGCGVVTEITIYAVDHSMPVSLMRCSQMDFRDFAPLPKIVDGEVVLLKHSLRAIHDVITTGKPSMVILSEAVTNGIQVAAQTLAQIADEATTRVVVPIIVLHDQRDAAMKAIALGLGLLPDDVAVHVVTGPEHVVEQYVAYARANKVDETILSMIETKKDFMGGTPHGWTRYSSFRQDPDYGELDRKTREAVAVEMVGQQGHDALMQWIRTGQ
jgi:hypothetical protein